MTCGHIVSRGREGQKGSWCVDCGEKVLEIDTRECQHCESARKLLDGWICHKHLMSVSPDMHVTFKVSEGSCWEPSNVELSVGLGVQ